MATTWSASGLNATTWTARTRKSAFWVVLLASLAVNAFFVGAMVTDFARFGHHHDDGNPRIARMELKWLAGRLTPQSVEAVEDRIGTLKPDFLARFDHLKKLRADLGTLVAAPSPDRSAIDDILREIRLEVGAMQEQVQSKTFDAVLALPPDERAALAKPPSAN